MNKNTSILLVAAVAGIMIAGTFAVTMTTAAFADNNRKSSDIDLRAGNGGIGGAGGAGGVAGNGGANYGDHSNANGGNANGGDGGSANGGNICNHVKGYTHTGEVCGSS